MSKVNRFIVFCILVSVLLVVLESEKPLLEAHLGLFEGLDVFLGLVFATEYVARLWGCVEDPRFSSAVKGRVRYALTPAAICDLLAVVPVFAFAVGNEAFIFRLFRLLRLLRLSKLGRYSVAAAAIRTALFSRRIELLLSLATGLVLMLVSASCLYFAEGSAQPKHFGSIPRALWWSVSALTTVGYGDVYPVTALGKFFASLSSIIGIGLIAMPVGILAAAFSDVFGKQEREKKAAARKKKDPIG